MSIAIHHHDFTTVINATNAEAAATPKAPGVLRRLADAIFNSRQRQVDRELAGYLIRSGGRITDSIERDMTNHLSRSDRGFRH